MIFRISPTENGYWAGKITEKPLESFHIIYCNVRGFYNEKIALITDGWQRYVTAAWIIGYRRYLEDSHLDASLYVFHSFGNFSKDEKYNQGEYNIYNLPRLEDFVSERGGVSVCKTDPQENEQAALPALHP